MRIFLIREDKKYKCSQCKSPIVRGDLIVIRRIPGVPVPKIFHVSQPCLIRWFEQVTNNTVLKWKKEHRNKLGQFDNAVQVKMGRPPKTDNPTYAVAMDRLQASIRHYRKLGGHEEQIRRLEDKIILTKRKKEYGLFEGRDNTPN